MHNSKTIPTHVAFIMDGNGRWAEAHGKARYEGHMAGVEPIRTCLKMAKSYGVRYLTFYAFSTENWGRPQAEVNALMELFCKSVDNETQALAAEGVRVRFIGRRDRFSEEVSAHLSAIENATANGNNLDFILAFDYSSREELTCALRNIAERVKNNELNINDITEQTISDTLYTAGIPDPDFIVRTSGEQRLSNFLLWQASYAEMYFPEVHWPDFDAAQWEMAMEEYAKRNRRYGLL